MLMVALGDPTVEGLGADKGPSGDFLHLTVLVDGQKAVAGEREVYWPLIRG